MPRHSNDMYQLIGLEPEGYGGGSHRADPYDVACLPSSQKWGWAAKHFTVVGGQSWQ